MTVSDQTTPSKPGTTPTAGDTGRPPAPPWWQKVVRVFVFTFLGTLATTLLPIADSIAKGEHVDYTAVKALLVSAIAGAFAAAIRAVVALLPVFKDDDVGMAKT